MVKDSSDIEDLQRLCMEIPSPVRSLRHLNPVRTRGKRLSHGRDLLPVQIFAHFHIRHIKSGQIFLILLQIPPVLTQGKTVFQHGKSLPVHRKLPVNVTIKKSDRDSFLLQITEQTEIQEGVVREMMRIRETHGFRAAFRIHKIKMDSSLHQLLQFADLPFPLCGISMDHKDTEACLPECLQHFSRS